MATVRLEVGHCVIDAADAARGLWRCQRTDTPHRAVAHADCTILGPDPGQPAQLDCGHDDEGQR